MRGGRSEGRVGVVMGEGLWLREGCVWVNERGECGDVRGGCRCKEGWVRGWCVLGKRCGVGGPL